MRTVTVGPAQLSVASYLRKLFEKDGLWTQPTLFGGKKAKQPTGTSPDYPTRAWYKLYTTCWLCVKWHDPWSLSRCDSQTIFM